MTSITTQPDQASTDVPNEASEKNPTSTAEEKEYLSGFKLFVLLGSLTLITFMVLLDTSIIGTAIPRITTQFHSLSDVGWYVGAYTLAASALQPLSGKLYMHFNTKTVYLTFVFTFELGSLVCGVAPSSVVFIIGRAIAGLGASGIINGALTMLAGAVPLHKSPTYTGALLGIAQIGILCGPLVGGSLTEHASWRWCFYINLPMGGIAALSTVLIHVPEITQKPRFSLAVARKILPDLDLFGFILFVPSSVMLLLALQFGSGNTYSWKSATIIGLFCGAGVMGVIFILWERRMGERAMVPGPLLKRRAVWTSCLFGTCIMSSMIIASNWMPTYFQAVKGEGPSSSGVHVLPSILSQMLLAIVSGVAVSKFGYYLPWAFGCGIVAAIGNGLISTFTASTSAGHWIGYQIVLGAGRGAGMQMAFIAVQNATPPKQISVGVALIVFCQNLGTAINIVIGNVIFSQTLTSVIPKYAPSVSPKAALDAGSGAAAVRNLALGNEEQLAGVLKAYSESLRNVFLFLVGISSVAMLVSVGMGWKDVRKKTVPKVAGDVAVLQGGENY